MKIDRESWWWQKGRLAAIIAGALCVTGWATGPLQQTPWREMRARQPELNLKDTTENLSQGAVLGLLGGFRSILADFLWIRGYDYWEARDLPNMMATLNLALTLDPSSVYFWNDAYTKVGLDAPVWLIENAKAWGNPAFRTTINRQQTERAIEILDRGLKFHPNNYLLLIDKAYLYERQARRANDTHDPDARKYLELAAEQYHLAAEQADSPFFAARIYARLLQDLGHDKQAYDYLRKLYPTLANDQVEARKVDVWESILNLEDKLKLPTDQRIPMADAPKDWKPEQNSTDSTAAP